MPRRTVESSDDEGGSTSNNANNARVKQEKVKQQKVKEEGRRRQQQQEEDDESNEAGPSQQPKGTQANDEDDGDEDREGSPRGNKRQRVNGAGEARSTSGASPEPSQQDVSVRIKTQPRDIDGYIPGSIVRIQLKNFVTYDYVEFRPGPYLNMIIGPNGTGKSSIACAIALGLNFPPKVLGRASELNSFVKNGTPEGYIEIELKGPAGRQNPVIRRNLTAAGKGSSFTLNGEPSTGKEVSATIQRLNVQVENLCSFLPQDKVSSFAAMSPQQLLVETQKAAGDPSLTSWFESLKELGGLDKNLKQKLKTDTDSCEQLKQRNEGIEQDVQRLKEQQKIKKEMNFCKILLPCTQFREKGQEYNMLKEQKAALHEKVRRLKAKNEPAHNRLAELRNDVNKAIKRRKDLKDKMQEPMDSMRKCQKSNEKFEKESIEIANELSNLRNRERDRHNKMKAKTEEITRLEKKLNEPAPDVGGSMEEIQDQSRHKNLGRRALEQEHNSNSDKLTNLLHRKQVLKGEISRVERNLAQLESPDGKKMQHLARWDKDTHDAVLWLRNNKDKFREEVFEPPYLSCSVKDPRFADYVESCFSATQLKTFICQNQDDMNTLNRCINDSRQQGSNKRISVAVWYRVHDGSKFAPEPLPRDQLQQYGFEGYAIDFLDYPPGMLNFLKEHHVHRIPVSRKHMDGDEVQRAMTLLGNPIVPNWGGGGTFVAGQTIYSVSRSRYGRKALNNVTRDLPSARNFVHAPVDTSAQERFREEAAGYHHQIAELDAQCQDLDPKLSKSQADLDVLRAEIKELEGKRTKLQNHASALVKIRDSINRARQKLEELKNEPSPEKQRKELMGKLWAITQKRIKLAAECGEVSKEIFKQQVACAEAGIKQMQKEANFEHLEALCAAKDAKYQSTVAHYNEVYARFKQAKEETMQYMNYAKQLLAEEKDEEIKKRIEDLQEAWAVHYEAQEAAEKAGLPPPSDEGIDFRSSSEVEDDIIALQAQLDIAESTNPGVIKEYETRKVAIEELEKSIKETEKKIEASAKKIKSTRDKWEPALRKLVDSIGLKFSAAFDRIGCAGEIKIKEDEDYEQWAIEIYVKFRDDEKLQLLTGQRQSGGERSLTTIMYLMSLTEEACAPFSLVDEINQGMDQRAERIVHNSMVNVTCKEDSSQYFLITPKLLTDLKYHERMKILCVNNGEWLPEESSMGNMMGMVNNFVRHRGMTHGSAAL